MLAVLNNEDISILDRQIDQLIDFKPIPEHEVKVLCEKVSTNWWSDKANGENGW